ncbi:hypothetical protein K435DRAFT_806076 [Dendrothele bispora CBS 962.96]|uniref:Uncharacterized protein n=1 Tax=Dendrothele bispora (strain CBS 962.96) TaxID=1314807 RepID=A0A4S8LAC0_DENBC|nr:hypothetical protein K435DRAFT_806076 [Dendrothele bispora CBS 962.96]
MPRKKGQKRAANLGDHYRTTKRPRMMQDSDTQDDDELDNTFLDSMSQHSHTSSERPSSVVTELSDLSEDEDIPEHCTKASLSQWLNIGRQKLQDLCIKFKHQLAAKTRKAIQENHLTPEPERARKTRKRTKRRGAGPPTSKAHQNHTILLKKTAFHLFRARSSNHSEDTSCEGDNDFSVDPFGIDDLGTDLADGLDEEIDAERVEGLGSLTQRTVTIETVEDEDDIMNTRAHQEEGLDTPGDVWDPSEEVSPQLNPRPIQPRGDDKPLFIQADDTFQPETPSGTQQPPGTHDIPSSASVDMQYEVTKFWTSTMFFVLDSSGKQYWDNIPQHVKVKTEVPRILVPNEKPASSAT